MEIWNEIWETVKRHKLRTAVTAFSVSWGIFMLVLLLAFGNGLGRGVAHTFGNNAINSIWLYAGKTSMPYKGLPKGRQIQFDTDDYELLKSELHGVEYISGRVDRWGAQDVSYKGKSSGYSMKGVHPEYRYLENTEVRKGRYINDEDIQKNRKVTVIGEPVAEFFFPNEDPLGKQLNVAGIVYQVVGVFYDDGGDRENKMLHVPLRIAQIAYNQGRKINQIMFTTADATLEDTKLIEKQVLSLLARRKNFDPRDISAINIRNNYENFEKFNAVIVFVKNFVGFVGIMTLIAGVVGVGNILLITVKERTKEFGIRKALGATPFSIVFMVVLESVVITFISGYLGLLASTALLQFINNTVPDMGYVQNPDIDLSIALIALFVLVFTGMLAGLLPAYRAAKINPIEALRSE